MTLQLRSGREHENSSSESWLRSGALPFVEGRATVPAKRRQRKTMPQEFNFLSQLTGSFSQSAAGNPTVAMIEAAYRHHELDWRYINCEVTPEKLGDAVRGARAMDWAGFNCSLPHKVAVIEHLDGLGESAAIMRAQALRWSRRCRWHISDN